MELGNILFGNSRGETPIPRECTWLNPLLELFDLCELDSGYPGFDNSVFTIRGYDWDAECTCGFDERFKEWHKVNLHSAECYQSALETALQQYNLETGYQKTHNAAFPNSSGDFVSHFAQSFETQSKTFMPGITTTVFSPRKDAAMTAYYKAREARDKFEERMAKQLCKTRNLSFSNIPWRVYCDCYKSVASKAWSASNDHTLTCRLVQPNFLFKPTGFKANWYKYPLRDSYMTPEVTLQEWVSMLNVCEKSVKNKS